MLKRVFLSFLQVTQQAPGRADRGSIRGIEPEPIETFQLEMQLEDFGRLLKAKHPGGSTGNHHLFLLPLCERFGVLSHKALRRLQACQLVRQLSFRETRSLESPCRKIGPCESDTRAHFTLTRIMANRNQEIRFLGIEQGV